MKSKFFFVLLCSLLSVCRVSFAQGTAFTYQGQLQNNGNPASGTYNLTFLLFNTNTSGVALAGPVTNNGVIVSNGLFTALIDFGPGVFTGASNWLEVAVRTNGNGGFTTLAPRQQVTPTPYAIFANTASNLTGNASTATTANNFSGSLSGDVTGPQGTTVVAKVGGQTAANVASGAVAANAATSANNPSTIVQRDGSGNFSAGTITLSGSLSLPSPASITSSGSTILYANAGAGNYSVGTYYIGGSGNTAVGGGALEVNSGNYNTAIGNSALNSCTSGTGNIALGYLAGNAITTGSDNIDIGTHGNSGDNNVIRIGSGQSATYLMGNVYGNSFNSTSDRNAKENFVAVNPQKVLDKVAALPITEWNYKTDSPDVQHIGPMAQDFQAAFGLNGKDDKHISVLDESGMALAAIQGLNQKLHEKDAEIQNLEKKLDELQAVVKQLAAQK
jgi:hypothetical protein